MKASPPRPARVLLVDDDPSVLAALGGVLESEGYGVVYDKGPAAAWPLIHQSFGELIFLLVALGAAIVGAVRGPQRLLQGLILAWFVPITVVVLWVTHFKFQYWLPRSSRSRWSRRSAPTVTPRR